MPIGYKSLLYKSGKTVILCNCSLPIPTTAGMPFGKGERNLTLCSSSSINEIPERRNEVITKQRMRLLPDRVKRTLKQIINPNSSVSEPQTKNQTNTEPPVQSNNHSQRRSREAGSICCCDRLRN